MTTEKVELGRYLFYDKRLSIDGTMACATCHRQKSAFTDGRRLAIGATGETHPRNAMGLANVAYFSVLTWADPSLAALETQALTPMFGEHPIEMGLAGRKESLLRLFGRDPRYEAMFRAAFTDDDPFSIANLMRALAAFERTLLSFDSPFSDAGLFVNMLTYLGYGAEYYLADSRKTNCLLYVHEKWTQIPANESSDVPISSMDIENRVRFVTFNFMADCIAETYHYIDFKAS